MEHKVMGTGQADMEEPSGWSVDSIRRSIDRIDTEIVTLLNKRLSLGKELGQIKKREGISVLDQGRETEVKQRLARINNGPLDENDLLYIFGHIITATRKIQDV